MYRFAGGGRSCIIGRAVHDPSYYEPAPRYQAPPRPKVKHRVKPEAAIKEKAAKPQGPLIIAISIDNQKVRVFDANGLFAESPVSTGMAGHPTPMGVFSIIQKHKFHHSNIYSDAPMPYMQRITWSGVALHAGVLPGYPASHGCIRMPMSFAVKMWNWTRMGARVIVTPDEITPVSFSHPMLVTQKVVPSQPVAGEEPKTVAPLGVKSDKGADAATQPAAREHSNCAQASATPTRPRRSLSRPIPPTPPAQYLRPVPPSPRPTPGRRSRRRPQSLSKKRRTLRRLSPEVRMFRRPSTNPGTFNRRTRLVR